MLRGGRMHHELFTSGDNPDREEYGINGYSASYEFGKNIKRTNGYYLEPQAQFVLGKLSGANYYTRRNSNFAVDSGWSAVGRLGLVLGRKLDQHNDYYFKANLYHGFAGSRDISFMASANNEHGYKEANFGGTWYELGLGTNVKLSRKTDFYGDVTKSFGEDIRKDWQFNVGMRFAF